MKKSDIANRILGERLHHSAHAISATAFASTNIALCKYWGKRDQELNLPMTSSLSISLGDKGTTTTVSISENAQDVMTLNDEPVSLSSSFGKRLTAFLDLFRGKNALYFNVDTQSNLPVAAGLASSASGFAALVLALDELFKWKLSTQDLSILARLGSGSACRSIWTGFVEWNKGVAADGMDSYGKVIPEKWPELCIGLLVISQNAKSISSRDAMQRTVDTSLFYSVWPKQVEQDLIAIKAAIHTKDFVLLGRTAESNALAMHNLMLSASPPINYGLPETTTMIQKIQALRQQGLSLYFTQDAGPNLKLLFLSSDLDAIRSFFPTVDVVRPFASF